MGNSTARPRGVRSTCVAPCSLYAAWLLVSPLAAAEVRPTQSAEENGLGTDPVRVIASTGAGASLRLVRHLNLNQSHWAPVFVDARAAVFLEGGSLRHGMGLGVTTNVSSEGPCCAVDPLRQWSIAPSYELLVPLYRVLPELRHDWLQLRARAGVPVVVAPEPTFGLEVGGGVAFQPLAGLGVYVDASFSSFFGLENTLHPLVSLSGGLVLNYEVLP